MLDALKIFLILLFRSAEQKLLQGPATRYLVKNYISTEEINALKWFDVAFYKTIGIRGILALLGIASFTIITFPLGIWLKSFSAGMFYPLSELFMTGIGMIMIPLTLMAYSSTVGEIRFNRSTILGLAILEISGVIAMFGWYLIYQGNKP